MRFFVYIWTYSFAAFVKTVANSHIQPTLHELSFLGLGESREGQINGKDAKISVNECSIETMNLILEKDQVMKLKLPTYHCYLKDLESTLESCKRRCRISRSIGRCRGIEQRVEATRNEYSVLRKEQSIWTNHLNYCIRCRSLTEYKLNQSKGKALRTLKAVESNFEDAAYTPKNMFESLFSRELAAVETLYIGRKELYDKILSEICKKKSRKLCSCAKKSLKELVANKKVLQRIILTQDLYQKRCYRFLSSSPDGVPLTGEPLETLDRECKHALEFDTKIQNEAGSISNRGFTGEELTSALTTNML